MLAIFPNNFDFYNGFGNNIFNQRMDNVSLKIHFISIYFSSFSVRVLIENDSASNMSEDERDETVGQVITYNNNKNSEQNAVSKYLNAFILK